MKKLNQWMLAAILLLCGTWALTSCSDENTDGGGDLSSEWLYKQYMNTNIKPGDNFFMFCNGGYWNRTKLSGEEYIKGFLYDEYEPYKKRYQEGLTFPMQQRLFNDVCNTTASSREIDEQLIESAVERLEAVQTSEQLWQTVGQLWADGYNVPFDLDLFSLDGKICAMVYLADDGDDDDEEEGESMQAMILKHPQILSCLQPVVGQGTRGFDTNEWPMLVNMLDGIGIPVEQVYAVRKAIPSEDISSAGPALREMQEQAENDLSSMVKEFQDFIKTDLNYIDPLTVAIAPTTGLEILEGKLDKLFYYECSKAYAEKHVTTAMQTRTQNYLEELREVFRTRLANNPWMSPASQAVMMEKLDAMKFFVCKPDQWLDEEPDYSGGTGFVHDLLSIRKARLAFQKKLIGMDKDEASFHIIIGFTEDESLMDVNACYMPNFNALYIFPAWAQEPLYSTENDDAVNYALCVIFAHEITHGFDNEGSLCDAIGNYIDGGIWATADDANKFEELTQLLVDCYNKFEVMPEELPGLYNNGTFTLCENIADVGGFEVAYEAFVNNQKNKGVSGDELTKKKRHFYEALANLWRVKYSAALAQKMTNGDDPDVHSLFKERINGIVSNTDAWYELFDVKPNQKLYIEPDKRAHIW